MQIGWIFYTVLSNLALPFCLPYLFLKDGNKLKTSLPQRIGLLPETSADVWIHGSSVGETKVSLAISDEIRKKGLKVLVTSMTKTAMEILEKSRNHNFLASFVPVDATITVSWFYRRLKGLKSLIIVEGDIWPNMIRWGKKRKIKVAVINGRMTPESFKRYAKIKKILNPFALIDLVLARTDEDAEMFRELGAKEVIKVGNIKFDIEAKGTKISRKELGISENTPVIVFGSIREGEEIIFSEIIRNLRNKLKSVLFILAPRHPERFDPEPFTGLGLSYRTSDQKPKNDIFVLDTLGELTDFYGLADVAVVGGSFLPYGGHNILEPISMGVPTLYGPHINNFKEEGEIFSRGRGGLMVKSPKEVSDWILKILSDNKLKEDMRQKGLLELKKNRGAIKKTLEILNLKGYI